jgi:hypothetical protein
MIADDYDAIAKRLHEIQQASQHNSAELPEATAEFHRWQQNLISDADLDLMLEYLTTLEDDLAEWDIE